MTQEEFDKLQDKALRYILISLIHRTNTLDELNDEDKETVLNNTFNAMLNSLKPDASIIWNELILSYTQKYKSLKNVDDIMQQIDSLKENGND